MRILAWLIRYFGFDTSGKLDKITINFTIKLKIQHYQGAGCEYDFTDKEKFQKQLKKKKKR
jgi:hypothetical protein